MVKITCCDICYAVKKLTESTRYMSVKGRRDLRLDYCDGCKAGIPKDIIKYVQFCYALKGIPLTEDEAKKMLGRK